MLITKINGIEYIFSIPDIDEYDPEDIINIVNKSCISNNIENLEEYPFAKQKIFEQLFKLKIEAVQTAIENISSEISYEKNGNIVKFSLGFYKFCGSKRSIEDSDQLYFMFTIGKFLFKIISFIDAYIKASSKK